MTFQSFSGFDYLKIDIANNFGLDKETWHNRIAWFNANEANLDYLVNQAAEPALFYAATQAWKDTLAGKPIGYMISLDATASGLQILAALTGDRSAAQLCNVVDAGGRQDAYTIIYNHMLTALAQHGKISRDDVKRAIMTSLYSSKAVPKQVFGEGALLALFYETMKAQAPAAWELNETMLQLWNPDTHSHDWIMPDNFHVQIAVMDTVRETVHFENQPFDVHYKLNRPMPEGRSLGANVVHAIDGMIVREMSRRCQYDQKKVDQLADLLGGGTFLGANTHTDDDKMVVILWDHYMDTGYLSARIIDHLNEDNLGHTHFDVIRNLLRSLPAKPFTVVPVHDCWRCLPHYGNDLRTQYNLQLQMIAKSELLSSLVSQLVGQPVQVDKLDPDLWMDIAYSNYALS